MVELFTNSGDPDQMPHSAASDLDLHFLPFNQFGGLQSSMSDKRTVSSKMFLFC